MSNITNNRFQYLFRALSFALAVTFFAQDIVWAYPDKLAPESFFRVNGSSERALCTFLDQLIENQPAFRSNISLTAIEHILKLPKVREWCLRNNISYESKKTAGGMISEILIFVPSYHLRYYDPALAGRSEHDDDIVHEKSFRTIRKELIRVRAIAPVAAKAIPKPEPKTAVKETAREDAGEHYMLEAIKYAYDNCASRLKKCPISAAIIFDAAGKEISRAVYGSTAIQKHAAWHAERRALREARSRNIPLEGATLVVTSELCFKCAQLIIGSGIAKCVFASSDIGLSTEHEGIKALLASNIAVEQSPYRIGKKAKSLLWPMVSDSLLFGKGIKNKIKLSSKYLIFITLGDRKLFFISRLWHSFKEKCFAFFVRVRQLAAMDIIHMRAERRIRKLGERLFESARKIERLDPGRAISISFINDSNLVARSENENKIVFGVLALHMPEDILAFVFAYIIAKQIKARDALVGLRRHIKIIDRNDAAAERSDRSLYAQSDLYILRDFWKRQILETDIKAIDYMVEAGFSLSKLDDLWRLEYLIDAWKALMKEEESFGQTVLKEFFSGWRLKFPKTYHSLPAMKILETCFSFFLGAILPSGPLSEKEEGSLREQLDGHIALLKSNFMSQFLPADDRPAFERIFWLLSLLKLNFPSPAERIAFLKKIKYPKKGISPGAMHILEPAQRALEEGRFKDAIVEAREVSGIDGLSEETYILAGEITREAEKRLMADEAGEPENIIRAFWEEHIQNGYVYSGTDENLPASIMSDGLASGAASLPYDKEDYEFFRSVFIKTGRGIESLKYFEAPHQTGLFITDSPDSARVYARQGPERLRFFISYIESLLYEYKTGKFPGLNVSTDELGRLEAMLEKYKNRKESLKPIVLRIPVSMVIPLFPAETQPLLTDYSVFREYITGRIAFVSAIHPISVDKILGNFILDMFRGRPLRGTVPFSPEIGIERLPAAPQADDGAKRFSSSGTGNDESDKSVRRQFLQKTLPRPGKNQKVQKTRFKDIALQFISDAKNESKPLAIIAADMDSFFRFAPADPLEEADYSMLDKLFEKELSHNECFIARQDDSYMVILPECTLIEARAAAEKVRLSIEKEFESSFYITASFGVGYYDGVSSGEDAFGQASAALEIAKKHGKNNVIAFIDTKCEYYGISESEAKKRVERLSSSKKAEEDDVRLLIYIVKFFNGNLRKDVLELIYMKYEGLLRSKARYVVSTRSESSTVDDLMLEGFIALEKAVRDFDFTKGTKFMTFLEPRVIGRIKQYSRDKGDEVRLPAWVQEGIQKLHKASSALLDKGIYEPTAEQLEEESGFTKKKVLDLQSVERQFKNLASAHDIEVISEDAFVKAQDRIAMEQLMKKAGISPEDQRIYRLSKELKLGQEKIASIIGTYQMDISRRLKKIKRKLEIFAYGDDILPGQKKEEDLQDAARKPRKRSGSVSDVPDIGRKGGSYEERPTGPIAPLSSDKEMLEDTSTGIVVFDEQYRQFVNWPEDEIIQYIETHKNEIDRPTGISRWVNRGHRDLVCAVLNSDKTWPYFIRKAGVISEKDRHHRIWFEKDMVFLVKNPHKGTDPASSDSWERRGYKSMVQAAIRLLGSWPNLLKKADMKQNEKSIKWSKKVIIDLLKHPPAGVNPASTHSWIKAGYNSMVMSALRIFGSWVNALKAAGIEPIERYKPWKSRYEIWDEVRDLIPDLIKIRTDAVVNKPERYPADEESENLARLVKNGNRAAHKALIETHVRLVKNIAINYASAYCQIVGKSKEDLFEDFYTIGMVGMSGHGGLVRAVESYDPDREPQEGTKKAVFKTYATACINGSMKKYLDLEIMRKMAPVSSSEDLPGNNAESSIANGNHVKQVDSAVITQESVRQVLIAKGFSGKDAEIAIEAFLSDESISEIAERHEVTGKYVNNRVRRARNLLRSHFSQIVNGAVSENITLSDGGKKRLSPSGDSREPRIGDRYPEPAVPPSQETKPAAVIAPQAARFTEFKRKFSEMKPENYKTEEKFANAVIKLVDEYKDAKDPRGNYPANEFAWNEISKYGRDMPAVFFKRIVKTCAARYLSEGKFGGRRFTITKRLRIGLPEDQDEVTIDLTKQGINRVLEENNAKLNIYIEYSNPELSIYASDGYGHERLKMVFFINDYFQRYDPKFKNRIFIHFKPYLQEDSTIEGGARGAERLSSSGEIVVFSEEERKSARWPDDEIIEYLRTYKGNIDRPASITSWLNAGHRDLVISVLNTDKPWPVYLRKAGVISENNGTKIYYKSDILFLIANTPDGVDDYQNITSWKKSGYEGMVIRPVCEYFGSWHKALEEAGRKPRARYKPWSSQYTDWDAVRRVIPDLVKPRDSAIVDNPRYPTNEEARELAMEVKKGNDAARTALIITHKRLVTIIASSYASRNYQKAGKSFSDMLDELENAGMTGMTNHGGLVRAAELYNPENPSQACFRTYAGMAIKRSVEKYMIRVILKHSYKEISVDTQTEDSAGYMADKNSDPQNGAVVVRQMLLDGGMKEKDASMILSIFDGEMKPEEAVEIYNVKMDHVRLATKNARAILEEINGFPQRGISGRYGAKRLSPSGSQDEDGLPNLSGLESVIRKAKEKLPVAVQMPSRISKVESSDLIRYFNDKTPRKMTIKANDGTELTFELENFCSGWYRCSAYSREGYKAGFFEFRLGAADYSHHTVDDIAIKSHPSEYRGIGRAMVSFALALSKRRGEREFIVERSLADDFWRGLKFERTDKSSTFRFDLVNTKIPPISIVHRGSLLDKAILYEKSVDKKDKKAIEEATNEAQEVIMKNPGSSLKMHFESDCAVIRVYSSYRGLVIYEKGLDFCYGQDADQRRAIYNEVEKLKQEAIRLQLQHKNSHVIVRTIKHHDPYYVSDDYLVTGREFEIKILLVQEQKPEVKVETAAVPESAAPDGGTERLSPSGSQDEANLPNPTMLELVDYRRNAAGNETISDRSVSQTDDGTKRLSSSGDIREPEAGDREIRAGRDVFIDDIPPEARKLLGMLGMAGYGENPYQQNEYQSAYQKYVQSSHGHSPSLLSSVATANVATKNSNPPTNMLGLNEAADKNWPITKAAKTNLPRSYKALDNSNRCVLPNLSTAPSIAYVTDTVNESSGRLASVVVDGVDADRIKNDLTNYEGEVYYPCAGGDSVSLLIFVNMFPKAKLYVLNDSFNQEENTLHLPDPEDYNALEEWLDTYYIDMLSRYFGHAEMTSFDGKAARISVDVTDAAMQSAIGRNHFDIEYRVGKFEDEKGKFGVIYVRMPGMGGRLARASIFWKEIKAKAADNAYVIVDKQESDPDTEEFKLRGTIILNNRDNAGIQGTAHSVYSVNSAVPEDTASGSDEKRFSSSGSRDENNLSDSTMLGSAKPAAVIAPQAARFTEFKRKFSEMKPENYKTEEKFANAVIKLVDEYKDAKDPRGNYPANEFAWNEISKYGRDMSAAFFRRIVKTCAARYLSEGMFGGRRFTITKRLRMGLPEDRDEITIDLTKQGVNRVLEENNAKLNIYIEYSNPELSIYASDGYGHERLKMVFFINDYFQRYDPKFKNRIFIHFKPYLQEDSTIGGGARGAKRLSSSGEKTQKVDVLGLIRNGTAIEVRHVNRRGKGTIIDVNEKDGTVSIEFTTPAKYTVTMPFNLVNGTLYLFGTKAPAQIYRSSDSMEEASAKKHKITLIPSRNLKGKGFKRGPLNSREREYAEWIEAGLVDYRIPKSFAVAIAESLVRMKEETSQERIDQKIITLAERDSILALSKFDLTGLSKRLSGLIQCYPEDITGKTKMQLIKRLIPYLEIKRLQKEYDIERGLAMHAVVHNPSDPDKFIKAALTTAERLQKEYDIERSLAMHAAVHNPTNPDSFIKTALTTAERLQKEYDIKRGLAMHAAVHNPTNPDSFIKTALTAAERLQKEYGIKRGLAMYAAVYNPSDPDKFIKAALPTAERLQKEYGIKRSLAMHAAVYNPSDPDKFIKQRLEIGDGENTKSRESASGMDLTTMLQGAITDDKQLRGKNRKHMTEVKVKTRGGQLISISDSLDHDAVYWWIKDKTDSGEWEKDYLLLNFDWHQDLAGGVNEKIDVGSWAYFVKKPYPLVGRYEWFPPFYTDKSHFSGLNSLPDSDKPVIVTFDMDYFILKNEEKMPSKEEIDKKIKTAIDALIVKRYIIKGINITHSNDKYIHRELEDYVFERLTKELKRLLEAMEDDSGGVITRGTELSRGSSSGAKRLSSSGSQDEDSLPNPKKLESADGVSDDIIRTTIDSLHSLMLKTQAIAAESKVLLSESLFSPEDRIALNSILNKDLIEILPPVELKRHATNRNASRGNLAIVLTEKEFNDAEIWSASDKQGRIRSSVLLLEKGLTDSNYLYLEGVVGLARAMMNRRSDEIKMYYRLMSDAVPDDEILKLINDENPLKFALSAILRLKPVEPKDAEEFNRNRDTMEMYLSQA